jgi:hypothetical protein
MLHHLVVFAFVLTAVLAAVGVGAVGPGLATSGD